MAIGQKMKKRRIVYFAALVEDQFCYSEALRIRPI
jgi:hypothetical protein